jgi:hypothetical protein
MRKHDFNKIKFYSPSDLTGGIHLLKAESILKSETNLDYEDINDVIELYNIKQYIDNDSYLKNWTQEDIGCFKKKVAEYDKKIGQFMSKIDDNNIIAHYNKLVQEYINSFWELTNNQKIYE